ncbi:hypothetical protein [Halorhabdus rudnickae]|uniref:hypothetical protein n=1 Tax=Halorhabdus rudnickae TaxID=1775544 RepID=UPI001082BF10|nr:hypothetical protein [Halorhabdus rudnickae]
MATDRPTDGPPPTSEIAAAAVPYAIPVGIGIPLVVSGVSVIRTVVSNPGDGLTPLLGGVVFATLGVMAAFFGVFGALATVLMAIEGRE